VLIDNDLLLLFLLFGTTENSNNNIFHGLLMSAKLSHLLLLVPFILRKESGFQVIPQSHLFLVCNPLSNFAESVAFVLDRFLHWGQKEGVDKTNTITVVAAFHSELFLERLISS
jgi:hypothetical protein